MGLPDYRSISFWHETVPGSLAPRDSLAEDVQVDVAIVGAGYTGLWTAYYLRILDPGIRVAVVESEIAGFGASGRNGGWCLGTLAGMDSYFEDPARRDGGIRLQRALFATPDEVARICAYEDIDCHFEKGGCVTVALTPGQLKRMREDLEVWRGLGFGDDDVRWLEPEECTARVRAQPNLGGSFLSHCAALHPARLVRGLAAAVERRDVALYERSPAIALEPGRVITEGGSVRADVVVRATEGYTRTLPGYTRAMIPLHSMMIATEPLPEEAWQEIGLDGRETFADLRHGVTYAQRTADGRFVAGSRGAYFYDSGIRDFFSRDDPIFREIQKLYESMLPVLRDFEITHRWGGPLGIPRDWRPRVGIDRGAGLAWAGGYVGEGVAASNLAARTLADLILEHDSDLVRLPLVDEDFPRWEPEPLRWLGIGAVTKLGAAVDEAELAGRPTPKLPHAIFKAFVGR